MADKGALESLGLGKEALDGADFDQIPENLGQSYPDPPQPGDYRFKLPELGPLKTCWAKVESEKYGTRINAQFEDDAALTIIQSPGGQHNGETFRWRCSNVPRERTKEKILVSDMDLVLRALGVTKRPPTNIAYAQALMANAGKEFGAAIEFSWGCRDDKPIRVDNGMGGTAEVEGKMGCGARYYQGRDVQKQPIDPDNPALGMAWPLRITCANPECGATIRAFPNLSGFKK